MSDPDYITQVNLPIELTNGNEGRTKHFGTAHSRRKRYVTIIHNRYGRSLAFDFPVRLKVIRILGPNQRLWDADSGLRGNWKEIQDALVACGWFHDDDPRYITQVEFDQDSSDRSLGPSVQVLIYRSMQMATAVQRLKVKYVEAVRQNWRETGRMVIDKQAESGHGFTWSEVESALQAGDEDRCELLLALWTATDEESNVNQPEKEDGDSDDPGS